MNIYLTPSRKHFPEDVASGKVIRLIYQGKIQILSSEYRFFFFTLSKVTEWNDWNFAFDSFCQVNFPLEYHILFWLFSSTFSRSTSARRVPFPRLVRSQRDERHSCAYQQCSVQSRGKLIFFFLLNCDFIQCQMSEQLIKVAPKKKKPYKLITTLIFWAEKFWCPAFYYY